MIPATYPSILDSSNRTKMLVYQVPSIVGLTRWIDYIPVKSPTSESDLTLANTFANEGFILTSKVNDITGLVPFKDYIPIYLDSTATKAWSADNDGYIPMAELAGLLLDFTTGALDPRIAFTRATNATVTNSAGVITYAPHNLLPYSEQFDNGAWTKTTTTVAANAIASPVNTTTGDTLTAGGANSTTLHSYTAIAQPYTFSIYIRRRTGTGTIEITADGSTYVAKTITSDWARYDTTITPTAGTRTPGVRIVTSGDAIDVWGAQLEIGSTATTYNSTTVKNLLGYSELFDNAAWAKSNSFVQTNSLTFSEAFDLGAWNKQDGAITVNDAIAPNGYQTADKYVANTNASSIHRVVNNAAISIVSGAAYTFSIYLKKAEHPYCAALINVDGVLRGVLINLNTGTIANNTNAPTSSSITPVGNDWHRISITATSNTTSGFVYVLQASETSNFYQGDNVSGFYLWGAQLVQGSDAGAYRRTDSASLPCYYPNHNGVVCAEQLHGTAANGTILESYTASGAPMTFSVWMRRITGTGNVDVTMDTGVTWTTQAITTSWARYSITSTPASGARTAGIRLVTSGDVIQVFGGQVSPSASLDDYVLNVAAAPTAAAYYGARFDYDPVTLAPKGLLIEEQRTNLFQSTTAFNNVTYGWYNNSGGYSVVTLNDTTGVDGTLSGAKIAATATTNNFLRNQLSGQPNNTVTTLSFYLKKGNVNYGILRNLAVSGAPYAWFNLNTGTKGTVQANLTADITNAGNGWYRCSITGTTLASIVNNYIDVVPAATDNSQTVNIGDYIYIVAPQLEAGAFATSYIPTVASQVTRAADVATIQGSNFYSWYNQNEGSVVVNADETSTAASGNRKTLYTFTAGNFNNIIRNGIDSGTVASFTSTYESSAQASLSISASYQANVFSKASTAYKVNDFYLNVNNGTASVDTAGVTPIAFFMDIGYGPQVSSGTGNTAGDFLNGHIKQISYYPQRLSNDVIKGLTA